METRLEELRRAYQALLLDAEKMKRGLFGQKRESAPKPTIDDLFQALLPDTPVPDTAAAMEILDELLGRPAAEPEDDEKADKKPARKVTPHGRRKSPPVVEERLVLEPPERTAPGGDKLVLIGEDTSTILERRPARLVRLTLVQRKYKNPEASVEEKVQIVKAPAPVLPIERGLCGPALLAFILVSKYQDHIPLHRQERIFRRDGVDVARSTMAGWIGAATSHLRFIVDAMWADSEANAPWIATDSTGLLVQDRDKCRAVSFFVVIAPRMHVLFRSIPGHATGDDVAKMLAGFQDRPVLSDASTVYHELHRTAGVVEVGCWAHARRYFFEALSTDRKRALVAIGLIGLLFEANRESTNEDGIVDGEQRKTKSLPILNALDAFVAKESIGLAEETPLKKAFNYLTNQRAPLRRFLEDARLRIDNNISELELRRQVIGRKNWLFCGSDSGVQWNTTTTSLLASCAMHDLEPQAYLRDVLTLLPTWPVTQALDLAPSRWAGTRMRDDVVATLAERDYLARAAPPVTPLEG